MLLLDRILQWTEKTRGIIPQAKPLNTAVRFRLDQSAQRFVDMVSVDRERLVSAAPVLFWPAAHCWIEWRGSDGHAYGVRFIGANADDEVHVGSMNLWLWPKDADRPGAFGLGRCDLQRRAHPIEIMNVGSDDLPQSLALVRRFTQPTALEQSEDDAKTSATILAVLSLLNSPRIVKITDISKVKINNRRLRGGKFPLLSFREVRIDLSKPDISALKLDSDGTRRPLHFVRAHLRLRLGSWEVVKPHWRGDPSIGMRNPAYKLTST